MHDNETSQYFCQYFAEWIDIYKKGAVRPVTYQKYLMTLRRLTELAPTLKICELNKRSYQALINEYAQTHERQTTIDFHHHLKAAILDMIDEGLLETDPTRKVVLKGKPPVKERLKYLSQFELQALLESLTLTDKPNWDWLILLIAKTGMRFSEALGLTPDDFHFSEQKVKIIKTWNYKSAEGGFAETKNLSSKRTILLDQLLNEQISTLISGLPKDKPIFAEGRVFNSTVNSRLRRLCVKAGVPVISLHCLRHTHASILIWAGVSVSSIAKRLGHANTTTTQETYLHIIKEMEDKDGEKIKGAMTELCQGA